MRSILSLTAILASCVALSGCEDRIAFDGSGAGGAGGAAAGGSGGGGGSAPACTSQQECVDAADGLPSACRDGLCVSLLSEDCTQVVGDLDASPVLVGALVPLTGASSFLGDGAVAVLELSHSEVVAAGGLPIQGQPGGAIAYIVCDEGTDPVRAASHLVDTVGVSAIVGPMLSRSVVEMAASVTIPGNAVLMSPTGDDPALTALPDNGLVWRVIASAALQTRAYPAIVAELEAKVRATLGLSPADAIRLAVVAPDDAWGSAMSSAAIEGVSFNGKSALENGADFASVTQAVGGDPSAAIAALVEHGPHLIIALGYDPVTTAILEGVESAWPAGQPRPEYLLPSPMLHGDLLAPIALDPSLAARVRGTRPVDRAGSRVYEAFRIRFEAAYGEPVSPLGAYLYDAAYAVDYGIVAAGQVPVLDGPSIALGLSRLSQGPVVEVGPNDIPQASSALAAGGGIDLEGASGALDFDPSTGEPLESIEVVCLGSQGQIATAGQTYDPESDLLSGTFACP